MLHEKNMSLDSALTFVLSLFRSCVLLVGMESVKDAFVIWVSWKRCTMRLVPSLVNYFLQASTYPLGASWVDLHLEYILCTLKLITSLSWLYTSIKFSPAIRLNSNSRVLLPYNKYGLILVMSYILPADIIFEWGKQLEYLHWPEAKLSHAIIWIGLYSITAVQ